MVQAHRHPLSSFFYDNGRMIDIGTLGGDTTAADMNESGQIVGAADLRPFLYSDGTMTEIGDGGAVDINDRGQVLLAGLRLYLQ